MAIDPSTFTALPSARAYFYDPGTSTPRTVYTDTALSVAYGAYVEADSNGMWPTVFVQPGLYDWLVKNSSDVAVTGYAGVNEDPSGVTVSAFMATVLDDADAATARSTLGVAASSDVTTLTSTVSDKLGKTSAGDTLSGNINNNATGFFSFPRGTTAQRASATSGCPKRYNDTLQKPEFYDPYLASWVQYSTSAFPRGYIDGCILSNNVSDANNDIDISAGVCRSDDNTTDIVCSGLTKRLDASWAVGSGNGGLDGGSKANSTWYHVFVIYDTTNTVQDYLFSTSATSPTLPGAYNKKRRIGAIRTDGSGNILAFHQYGDEFLWNAASSFADVSAETTSSTAASKTLTVPTGVKVYAKIWAGLIAGSDTFVLFTSLDTPDLSAIVSRAQLRASSGFNTQADISIRTNTSAQVRMVGSGSSGTISAVTYGWVDPRGRNA